MGWLPAENDIPFDVTSTFRSIFLVLAANIFICLEYGHIKYYHWRFHFTAKYCHEFNTAALRACVPVEIS